MKTIAILLFSLTYTLAGQFGTPELVLKNTDTVIYFPGSSSLIVKLSGDSYVTVSLYNVSVDLPNGSYPLSFGTNVGYTITMNPSVGILHATFITPPISSSFSVAEAQAHVLQYDASTMLYCDVDARLQPVNGVDQQFVVELPATGTYVFVMISAGSYVPSFYGRRHVVPANTPQWWSFPNGFYLELNSGNDNHITVNYTQTNIKRKDPSDKIPYGAWFQFIADVENNLTAVIKFHYGKGTLSLKTIQESSLQIGYYDDASGSWQFLSSGGSVDTSAQLVIQNTDHFSYWGVYGKQESSATTLFRTELIFAVAVAFALLML